MCASSNIESQNTTIGDKDIGDVQDGNSCSGTHRPDIEHITTYLERMELYFISNDIADAKKATFVLTCISRKTYRIVKSLLDLNLPISKSFPDIKETLKSHFLLNPLSLQSSPTSTVEGNNLVNQSLISLLSWADWL